jgi:hypothetical protein
MPLTQAATGAHRWARREPTGGAVTDFLSISATVFDFLSVLVIQVTTLPEI